MEETGQSEVGEEVNYSRSLCLTRHKKVWLLFFSVLYIPLFAGAFYGFGPMQIMLEESGAFSYLCTNDEEDSVCSKQTARLLTVPFVGQLMILTSPLHGYILDRFGPLVIICFLGFCGSFGVAMLVTAVSLSMDILLYFAFISIGLMAACSSIMTVRTGMVFADDHCDPKAADRGHDQANQQQRRVISTLNTLFDAGSVTYLGLWGLTETALSTLQVLGGYLSIAIFCFGGIIITWISLGHSDLPNRNCIPVGEKTATTETCESLKQPEPSTTPMFRDSENNEIVCTQPFYEHSEERDSSSASRRYLSESSEAVPVQTSEYISIAHRSSRDQLLSIPFILLLLFFAINLGLNQFVLTTSRDFLGYLGDDEQTAKKYLTIFTLLMPASVLGLPLTDWVVARFGFLAGFQCICLLAAAHGIIQVICDQLNWVQILGFVIFSFYRCFLFSIVFSFVPTLLSSAVVGKGVGMMHFAGGVFSFVNIPLSNLAMTHLGGNFLVPNILYTFLVLPCSAAAFVIGKYIQRESDSSRSSN